MIASFVPLSDDQWGQSQTLCYKALCQLELKGLLAGSVPHINTLCNLVIESMYASSSHQSVQWDRLHDFCQEHTITPALVRCCLYATAQSIQKKHCLNLPVRLLLQMYQNVYVVPVELLVFHGNSVRFHRNWYTSSFMHATSTWHVLKRMLVDNGPLHRLWLAAPLAP